MSTYDHYMQDEQNNDLKENYKNHRSKMKFLAATRVLSSSGAFLWKPSPTEPCRQGVVMIGSSMLSPFGPYN